MKNLIYIILILLFIACKGEKKKLSLRKDLLIVMTYLKTMMVYGFITSTLTQVLVKVMKME